MAKEKKREVDRIDSLLEKRESKKMRLGCQEGAIINKISLGIKGPYYSGSNGVNRPLMNVVPMYSNVQ